MRLPSASLLFPRLSEFPVRFKQMSQAQPVSLFQGSGQQENPGSWAVFMSEHRNVFINSREARDLGRSE